MRSPTLIGPLSRLTSTGTRPFSAIGYLAPTNSVSSSGARPSVTPGLVDTMPIILLVLCEDALSTLKPPVLITMVPAGNVEVEVYSSATSEPPVLKPRALTMPAVGDEVAAKHHPSLSTQRPPLTIAMLALVT